MRYVNSRARELVNGFLTRELALLFLGLFCVEAGFAVNRTVFVNFIVEEFKVSGAWRGFLESVREVPGLLSILVAALTAGMGRSRLGALSLLVMGLGIGGFSLAWGSSALVLFTIFWSIGFHSWSPVRSSLTLALAGPQEQGRRLGQAQAMTALAGLVGMSFVERAAGFATYRAFFLVAGLAIVLGGASVGLLPRELGREKKTRQTFKRRYWLYYALQFLEGCRRQLFATFAPFALVQIYHVSVREMARLMLVNSLLNLLISPLAGHLVDRWGERRTLSLNFLSMALVMLAFATSRQVSVLYILYCLGNVLFILSLGVTTYLQKIALPGDLGPSLAAGQTMNHISAVVMPLMAGLLWMAVGPQWAFFVGVGTTLLSFFVAERIRI